MIPTILQIGPVVISTLGVFMALGFFFASFLIWQKGREEHYEEVLLMDGILLVTLASLMAARVWFVILNLKEQIYLLDLVGNPGFSWQGALIGGIISLGFYSHSQKWDFFKVADSVAFGLVIGLIFAHLGQFLSQFQFNKLLSFIPLVKALLLIIIYRLLAVFDKNYRTYEWYKNKRGETNTGFLFLSFLLMVNFLDLVGGILSDWPRFFNLELSINGLIFLGAIFVFYLRAADKDLTTLFPYKKIKTKQAKLRFKAGMEAKPYDS